ncbi:MAG: hypothetical protein SPLUMA2_SPLUMAMAG2_01790 [uncultured Sulfurimonas sp.]|nr:MAG: hypothetical protein SPLUMA2_SPLUMAMAG2_01790 [uncultured Sulfurimonas sp.]
MKQTREHQTTLNAKVLSQVNLQDIVNIATEFSINLEFVSSAIETMNSLKNTKLASLINKYEISLAKQEQVLQEVMKRDFQGELNE